MKVLYVNACVREESRTNKLALDVLKQYGDYEEVYLETTSLAPLHRETLANRTSLLERKDYSSPIFDYAKQFATADIIVIAAPYWDLSFPALLKIYLENIYVTGLVSRYSSEGVPEGLCKAQKLYYVTTAGGPYNPKYSYDYIHDMATNFFGIKETELVMEEMLDV